ncbi:MAG: hypothetical protein EVB11_02390 [Winogradskyella sp.]|nr:MAG: hypothetical protein EVB11_02390 [Winogradskyella sp.]
MRKITLILLVFIGFSINAQAIDYNTTKGFVAEGYDVVSYFNNNVKEGGNKYVAAHDGAKYKFSSQKNLDTFKANTRKYVPQYGGYCAYALAVKAKKVSIDPETFEIRDGKLYLFYNSWGSNALKLWLKESPNALVLKADENWKTLKGK